MTLEERHALVSSYLGKTVDIKIDRPIGYVHKKGEKVLHYPINYGYIPGVLGGDGEELDVYLLGVPKAVKEYRCKIIGIVYRENDVEDKLIAAPENMKFTQNEIAEAIHFQEKYYKTSVEAVCQKSCGAVIFRRNGSEKQYLCIKQPLPYSFSVPKGHMDAFETEEQTAKREIFEEIGVDVDLIPGFRVEVEYGIADNKHKTLVLFLAEWSGKIIPNKNEVVGYCWCDAEKAKETLPPWYGEVIDSIEARF